MRHAVMRLGLGLGVLLCGCNSFRLKPPEGFAEVDKDDYGARMKAGDDVGLNLRVFDNVRGGTLVFWSEDLVKKLGKRGYQLVGQSEVKSKNGVAGTRFDFAYTPPGSDAKKFYTAMLFVSDENVVIVQLAGDDAKRATYSARATEIASATAVRGCKSWTKVCHGPQPGKLTSPPPDPVPGAPTETAIAAETTEPGGS
jgi:hypothetical protein